LGCTENIGYLNILKSKFRFKYINNNIPFATLSGLRELKAIGYTEKPNMKIGYKM